MELQVHIKDFDVDMTLGNNGLTLQIWDNQNRYLGKLRIGKATVEWCAGRTHMGNGKKLGVRELIDIIQKT